MTFEAMRGLPILLNSMPSLFELKQKEGIFYNYAIELSNSKRKKRAAYMTEH